MVVAAGEKACTVRGTLNVTEATAVRATSFNGIHRQLKGSHTIIVNWCRNATVMSS